MKKIKIKENITKDDLKNLSLEELEIYSKEIKYRLAAKMQSAYDKMCVVHKDLEEVKEIAELLGICKERLKNEKISQMFK